ncbi:unnamed protein product [Peniophora sp. CBMAI 1063]|nr:unnamed protein product [Peniophora sp. CBMAI 1063]
MSHPYSGPSRNYTPHREAPIFAESPSHPARYSTAPRSGVKRTYTSADGDPELSRSAKKPRDREAYDRAKSAMDAFHSSQTRPLRPVYGDTWREGLRSVIAGTHHPSPAPVDQYGDEIKHPWYRPVRKSAEELRAHMVKWGEAIDGELRSTARRRGDVDDGRSRKPVDEATPKATAFHEPTKTYISRASDVCTHSYGGSVLAGVGVNAGSGKASAV